MRRRTPNATTSLKTLPGALISDLSEALRRYSNARRRARYWSGTPNFNTALRSNEGRTSELDLKYELAMCDCDSWENRIGELTGKGVKHYDPKQDFRRRFAALMSKSAND